MMQLVTVIVVVLFAIPALLYLVGLAAKRYVGNAPRWVSLPIGRKTTTKEMAPESSARRQA